MTVVCEAQAVSVGDVFQEAASPNRCWRVIGCGQTFHLVCIEEPHLFRFLSPASLADPLRYTRTESSR